MAHSFFTGTDAQLYTGSAAFSAQISLAPELYGLLESQAAEYASLNAIYAAYYLAAHNAEQRTTAKVVGKNEAGLDCGRWLRTWPRSSTARLP